MIDLSDQYNCLLDESWPGLESLRPLAGLHSAVHGFNGAGFDVRGAIQLTAARPGLVSLSVSNFQHCYWIAWLRRASPVGCYPQCPPETLWPIVCFTSPMAASNGFACFMEGTCSLVLFHPWRRLTPLRDAKLAWTDVIGESRAVRLYQCEWTNPSPNEIIERMDFVSSQETPDPSWWH